MALRNSATRDIEIAPIKAESYMDMVLTGSLIQCIKCYSFFPNVVLK